MRKIVVTAAGTNMAPVLDLSLPFFTRFAKCHSYTMDVQRMADDDADRWSLAAKGFRWQKLSFIRSALELSDVAVWFDADVLLCRTDTDILDTLSATDYQGLVLHSAPAANRINPNMGVWVLRNTDKAFCFLDEVAKIGMPAGPWSDQGAVLRALGWTLGDEDYYGARMPETPTEFMDGTAWLPIGWNWPYLAKFRDLISVFDPFATHFMGMSLSDRLRGMREVAGRI